MQTKSDLEKFYDTPDPWGYRRNRDDKVRRQWVQVVFNGLDKFGRGLELGSGEGFMTVTMPCREIDCLELSDKAAKRNPYGRRVKAPSGKYDIILACGVLYEQYDYQTLRDYIENHANGYVLTCHYDKAGKAHDEFDKEQVFYAEFPYRDGKQTLRLYKW